MKLIDYVKDKIVSIILFSMYFFFILFLFSLFNVSFYLYFFFITFSLLLFLFLFLYDYVRRSHFYNHLLSQLEHLDKKYLLSELMNRPHFLDGEIIADILYETNKSMEEHLVDYRSRLDDFKEYLELWIHEMKIPLSSLHFFLHNYETIPKEKLAAQLNRLETEVERVLFYVRSETAEKDYAIKMVSIKKIVHEVVQRQKDAFIDYKIGLELDDLDVEIKTDQKWLGFIVSQVIQNSIQYRNENPKIHIYTRYDHDILNLIIEDNGIGIVSEDLPRVFEKTFTGTNGRGTTATGIGLYVSKRLMDQLGHKIEIESNYGTGTKVILSFYDNHYYDVY